MDRSLSNKLLTFRAKQYASCLLGAESYRLQNLLPEDFCWHRETINFMHSLTQKTDGILLPKPARTDDITKTIMNASNVKNTFDCWIFFENQIGINFHGHEFGDFLKSLFHLNKSYDIQLAFTNPDFMISLNDEEHFIEIHIIKPSKKLCTIE